MIARACALGLILVTGIGTAHAETDPCATLPADPSTRAMQVKLFVDDHWGDWLLAADDGAAFPAVSKDGKTIVQLFQDEADFSGEPITTLVFWSNRGKRLAVYGGEGTADPNHVVTAAASKRLAAANKRLAATTWRPLAIHNACAPADPADALDASGSDDEPLSRVKLDGDVEIALDPSTARLTKRVANGRATPIRDRFIAPGWRSADEGIPAGGCGSIRRVGYGFGGRDLGVAILVGEASRGGDSCFGQPSADGALVIKLR